MSTQYRLHDQQEQQRLNLHLLILSKSFWETATGHLLEELDLDLSSHKRTEYHSTMFPGETRCQKRVLMIDLFGARVELDLRL